VDDINRVKWSMEFHSTRLWYFLQSENTIACIAVTTVKSNKVK